jgi:hypothetical protein
LWWEWRTVRAWIGAGAGSIAAVATGYLVWVQLHPEDGNKDWEIRGILIVGTVSVVTAFAPLVRIYTIERFDKHRERVAVALRGLPWAVHESTKGRVPVPPLGASAWVIRGWGPFRHLRRIGRERVNDTPGPSNILWTKGKGVIGRTWQTGQVECANTGAFDTQYGQHQQAEWDRLDHDARGGLSYKEYVQIRGKYGTVIAVPMVNRRDGQLLGVVALDGPPGCHEDLSEPKIIQSVGRAAGVVSILIT